jgi:hypothetical protein
MAVVTATCSSAAGGVLTTRSYSSAAAVASPAANAAFAEFRISSRVAVTGTGVPATGLGGVVGFGDGLPTAPGDGGGAAVGDAAGLGALGVIAAVAMGFAGAGVGDGGAG